MPLKVTSVSRGCFRERRCSAHYRRACNRKTAWSHGTSSDSLTTDGWIHLTARGGFIIMQQLSIIMDYSRQSLSAYFFMQLYADYCENKTTQWEIKNALSLVMKYNRIWFIAGSILPSLSLPPRVWCGALDEPVCASVRVCWRIVMSFSLQRQWLSEDSGCSPEAK